MPYSSHCAKIRFNLDPQPSRLSISSKVRARVSYELIQALPLPIPILKKHK